MPKKKGFTLVELLVVIAILAIIALIAIPLVFIAVKKSRAEAAKDNAIIYLKSIENYMVLHKADPTKYPFEFEPGKTYIVDEIKKIIGEDIKNPTSGSVQTGKDNNVDNASVNIDGYDITCTSSGECEVGEKPVIHIIVPDGWDNAKEIEVIVVKKGLGLADEPFSYDGGNTWTDEKIKTITENGEIEFHAKDKNGKEIDEIYICTKKVNGKGENCYKYEPGSGKKDGSGKIIINTIDSKAPTCELEIAGTKNVEGYYNSDIAAKISKMEDPSEKGQNNIYYSGSGIKSSSINYTKITQDGTYEIVGTVIDNAGNKGTCKKTVTKDTVKPTVEVTVDGKTRSDGYESGAKVIVKCTDNTGKISYQTPDVVLNGGGSKTVTATCKDNAGNEVTTTKTYTVYEYSSAEACGYNSCENSACGTATGTRSTGKTYACGSYKCGTTRCDDFEYTGGQNCYDDLECYDAQVCVPETVCTPTQQSVKQDSNKKGSKERCTTKDVCHKNRPCKPTKRCVPDYHRVQKTCPEYCTKYCDKTENYTYTKTCETKACGNKECWHK